MKNLMLTQYTHKHEAAYNKFKSYLNLCTKFQDKFEGLLKERSVFRDNIDTGLLT